jgi:hypothetical protein
MIKSLCAFFVLIFGLSLRASTILFIGDSHSVGPFGWTLDQLLRDKGHHVATYASCGSIGKWWFSGQKTPCGFFSRDLNGNKTQLKQAPTPLISNLLSDIKPEWVIMEFGGNYVKTPSDEFVIQDIQKLVTTVKSSGAKCLWVTNPDTRTYRTEIPRLISLIKKAVSDSCPVFESHLVTRYPETGGDGVHYWNTLGTPIAKEWAAKVFTKFKELNP